MHSEHTPHAIAAGFASAAIFILLYVMSSKLPLSIFCVVPLLYVGISRSIYAMAVGIALGSFILLGFSAQLLLIYLVVMALPALLFLANIVGNRPAIYAISEVVIYAVVLCFLIQLPLLSSGGIRGVISDAFNQVPLDDIDPEIIAETSQIVEQASFLIIAVLVWFCCLMLYGCSWIVAALLRQKGIHIDSFIIMDQTHPPASMLLMMIILAILSVLAGDIWGYTAKLNFMIILLPYVFSGAMYTPLRNWWGMRSGWSVFVYAVAFMFTWLAIVLAAIGVVKHIEASLKK